MSGKVRMLQDLTLDAVKAESIAHHLQRGDRSHFNPDVSANHRLAVLGEMVGSIFQATAIVPDPAKLQRMLLELASISAIWAELIDTKPTAFARDEELVTP